MSYTDHDPDAHENEPWWFYLWCIWGLVCATIIFAVDGHLAASLIWLGTAVLVGRFGMPVFSKLADAVFIFQRWRCKAAEDAEDEQAVQAGDSFSLVGWGARRQLDILDPARKPWDLYGSHLLVGVFHGLLLGPILCSLSPILEGPTDTALGGALLGVVLGPITLCLLIAIAFPLELVFSFPGPSIDDIRPTVNSAAEEADRLGHAFVAPGHLLLAILRNPAEQVAQIVGQRVADFHEIAHQIDCDMPQLEEVEEILEADTFCDVVQDAVETARKLKHDSLNSGHLLSALLEVWPTATAEALERMGLSPATVRRQLDASR